MEKSLKPVPESPSLCFISTPDCAFWVVNIPPAGRRTNWTYCGHEHGSEESAKACQRHFERTRGLRVVEA
jgi:hypothetical protein